MRETTSSQRWTAEPSSKPSESGKRKARQGSEADAGAASASDPAHPDGPLEGALATAAERIAAQWARREHKPVLLQADFESELTELVAAVDRAARSDTPDRIELDFGPSFLLRRRLLELLGAELVGIWAEQPPDDPAEMLRILRSITAARRILNPEWTDDDVAGLLSAPDGLGLVAEVAHDLRSPLTAMLFLSDTLRRGHSGPLNDVQLRQLALIYSSSLGLIEVASDLIELARGGDRLPEAERRPFSLAETLESVRSIVQPMAEEKGIQLLLTSTQPDVRSGYPVAINRILLNLASNAIKFTDDGTVDVRLEADGPVRIRFSVKDTGTGIPEENRDTLFMPFRSRRDSGYYFSGTGLGLTIARRLVRAMGSELEFETGESGTRFFFVVPVPPATRF